MRRFICLALFALASPALAQDEQERRPLGSDPEFPNFIGFLRNPAQAIDPRSLTQLWPLFATTTTPSIGRLPSGDSQIYGMGLNLALTDRLSIGMNNGGYAAADYRKNRQGWLDLGGFAQYTLIRDVENQFLFTVGLNWVAPCGSSDVFQGSGPAYLAPYVTAGKEIGCWHVLATTGYSFPCETGSGNTNTFYGTVHIDRQLFGWVYPVVEFSWNVLTTEFDINLPTRRGIINLATISTGGTAVTVAPGVNFVLIPNQVEWGVVYETPMYTQRGFQYHQVLTKMIVRF